MKINKIIKDLKKEIEEETKIFETLDIDAQKRLRKEFDRVTKTERLFVIEELKAKLQTLQQVCEEIEKYRVMIPEGDSDEIMVQRAINTQLYEIVKKFQGEESSPKK